MATVNKTLASFVGKTVPTTYFVFFPIVVLLSVKAVNTVSITLLASVIYVDVAPTGKYVVPK